MNRNVQRAGFVLSALQVQPTSRAETGVSLRALRFREEPNNPPPPAFYPCAVPRPTP